LLAPEHSKWTREVRACWLSHLYRFLDGVGRLSRIERLRLLKASVSNSQGISCELLSLEIDEDADDCGGTRLSASLHHPGAIKWPLPVQHRQASVLTFKNYKHDLLYTRHPATVGAIFVDARLRCKAWMMDTPSPVLLEPSNDSFYLS